MPDPKENRRNSVDAAPPFNRIRIILAVIMFAIAIVVIAWQVLS